MSLPREAVPFRQRILDAESEQAAIEMLQASLSNQLAQILQLPPRSVLVNQPLIELGVDSLMAVEISSRLSKDLAHKVSVLKILSGLSIAMSKCYLPAHDLIMILTLL
jgi:acyl carrier protein